MLPRIYAVMVMVIYKCQWSVTNSLTLTKTHACEDPFFPLSLYIRYREVCDYNFDTHRSVQLRTGHFTQMVWKKSVELGVGVATGTKHGLECTCIVARYRPAGYGWRNGAKFNINILIHIHRYFSICHTYFCPYSSLVFTFRANIF